MKVIDRVAKMYDLTGRLILNNKRLIVYSQEGKDNHPHLFAKPFSGE